MMAIIQAGGFWVSDDRCIALFGAIVLAFFLGLHIGENRKK
jgi:hypothetical protein